jgi:hypothetical protein
LHAWCDRCDADATARSGEGHDQFSVATDVAVLGTCDIAVAQLLLDEHLRGGAENGGRGATDPAFAHGGATESLLPKWGRWRHAVVTLVESAMEEDTWCAAEAALLAEDVGGAQRRGFAVLTPASALRRIEACDAELTRGLAKGERAILSSSLLLLLLQKRGFQNDSQLTFSIFMKYDSLSPVAQWMAHLMEPLRGHACCCGVRVEPLHFRAYFSARAFGAALRLKRRWRSRDLPLR